VRFKASWRVDARRRGHHTDTGDPIALQCALDALAHPGPANPGFTPRCG